MNPHPPICARAAAVVVALVVVALSAGPVAAQPPAAPSASAASAEPIRGRVMVILATREAGLIDPRLRRVQALRQPPFNEFRSMALLSSPRIDLRLNEPQVFPLPNGRRMRVIVTDITDNGRFRVRVSINRPEMSDYLPEAQILASPGDAFFVAGQSFRDGMLVIGVRLGSR